MEQIESETFTITAIDYDSFGVIYIMWNSGYRYWWDGWIC